MEKSEAQSEKRDVSTVWFALLIVTFNADSLMELIT